MSGHTAEIIFGVSLTLGMASTLIIATVRLFGAEIKKWTKR